MKQEVLDLIEELLEMMGDLEGNNSSLDKAYDLMLEAKDLIVKYAEE